ncbi:hypothetical protein KSI28_24245, partial [Salmonella enterica subsp. enterica serovar Indiana]|nr:hypothetical protein [Salmonella enterica subsp. enterica serovar Indiana]MCC1832720.1 hypothetical protein [Salmonella enterica subsp. enterica serovar Indiana]
PAFEWVHVQLHQQKGMISLSPPTICNSADSLAVSNYVLSASNFVLGRLPCCVTSLLLHNIKHRPTA